MMTLEVCPYTPNHPSEAGFTLLELLVVMAVMSIMMIVVLPAVSGISGAGKVTKAAFDVAGTLEQARAYAMANNTYVFVGFTERDGIDPSKTGIGQILVASMGSIDGTRNFGANNSNLFPLAKLRRIDNAHLQDSLPNSGAMERPLVDATCRVGSDTFQLGDPFTSGFSFSPGNYSFTKIIQFDPRGSASIPSSTLSIPHFMEIGFVGARGNLVASTTNCAALILFGITGSVKIYRP
jgi:prepilin-type N-terminal cleavage/methylation domain-containing protein